MYLITDVQIVWMVRVQHEFQQSAAAWKRHRLKLSRLEGCSLIIGQSYETEVLVCGLRKVALFGRLLLAVANVKLDPGCCNANRYAYSI
jgi:hypothetical protein